jgi:hypothetical protein
MMMSMSDLHAESMATMGWQQAAREQKVVTNFLQDFFPPLCIIWIQEIVR